MRRASREPGRSRGPSCCGCTRSASRSSCSERATTWPSASEPRGPRRPPMRRWLFVAALATPLIAWSWLRLESGGAAGEAALIVILALLPAFVPARRLQVAVTAVALLVAGAIAFDLAPTWRLPGQVPAHFGDGFLEFYDVQIPF